MNKMISKELQKKIKNILFMVVKYIQPNLGMKYTVSSANNFSSSKLLQWS